MWPFKRRRSRLVSRLRITPPEPAADRSGIVVVVIAWNEGHNIDDWLTFHALIGVSRVILYDNASSDDTVARALAHPLMDVTVVPWTLNPSLPKGGPRLHQQTLAYAHAIQTFGPSARRMAFIDVDEFLVPTDGATLHDALHAAGDAACVALPWVMFGHGGHDERPDAPVPFAYTQRAAGQSGPLLNFKCIVDPCAVTQVGVHSFDTVSLGAASVNTEGTVAPHKSRGGDFVTLKHLQLNHYYLKSRAEMEAKITGKAVALTPTERKRASMVEKAALIEGSSIEDRSAPDLLARHGVTSVADFRAAGKGAK